MSDLEQARRFALSLPGATEEPHFDMSSFRVRGKIFATVPPDEAHLHVFVEEPEIQASVAEHPVAFEPLLWGQRVRGLRINLGPAPDDRVRELIEESWRRRAPKRLIAERDNRAQHGSAGPRTEHRSEHAAETARSDQVSRAARIGRQPSVPGPDLAAIARAIIDASQYMTLATADAEGQPWVSPVFYATADHAEFYWISSPETTHSRNLAQRPRVSIVIFDSTVRPGEGQAVYLSATAGQVSGDDLGRGLAVYPGPAERGWSRRYTPDQLQGAAPYRLYRATAFEHSILCPRDAGPCPPHGLSYDHRTPVGMAEQSR